MLVCARGAARAARVRASSRPVAECAGGFHPDSRSHVRALSGQPVLAAAAADRAAGRRTRVRAAVPWLPQRGEARRGGVPLRRPKRVAAGAGPVLTTGAAERWPNRLRKAPPLKASASAQRVKSSRRCAQREGWGWSAVEGFDDCAARHRGISQAAAAATNAARKQQAACQLRGSSGRLTAGDTLSRIACRTTGRRQPWRAAQLPSQFPVRGPAKQRKGKPLCRRLSQRFLPRRLGVEQLHSRSAAAIGGSAAKNQARSVQSGAACLHYRRAGRGPPGIRPSSGGAPERGVVEVLHT